MKSSLFALLALACAASPASAQVPTGKMGTGWDVAHAVLFLASDEAAYITGTEIIVDGGMSAMMPGAA